MERTIKILIGIVIVICIISLVVLICLQIFKGDGSVELSENENIIEVQDPNNPGVTIQEEYNIEKLRNAGRFFTVQDCVQAYINDVKEGNTQAILDVLAPEYINANNINANNISNFINGYQGDEFVAKKMEVLGGDIIAQHRVYGYISENGNKQYLYFKVDLDLDNRTFTILPCIGSAYKSLDSIELKENNIHIEKNGNNEFSFKDVSKEDICRIYQRYYNNLLLNDPEEAYKLLDDEYRDKRFSGYDDFQKYIQDNKDAIEVALAGYSVNYGEEKTNYVLQNAYGNYFLIEEDSIMNFTIKLDAYTVLEGEFNEKYSKLKEAEKASANIGIFIQMINNRDYVHAYEKLSSGFKNNYFKTQEDFENYIKSNWHYVNSYNINNYSSEGNIYIYDISLTDPRVIRGDTTINKTLNIRLDEEDDTNYEISFNVD